MDHLNLLFGYSGLTTPPVLLVKDERGLSLGFDLVDRTLLFFD